MATVYLPVQETIQDMTSAERAEAIDREVWRLRRPLSVQSPNDVTQFYYPRITHPTTGQVAIVGDTTENVKIHPDVDLTSSVHVVTVPDDPMWVGAWNFGLRYRYPGAGWVWATEETSIPIVDPWDEHTVWFWGNLAEAGDPNHPSHAEPQNGFLPAAESRVGGLSTDVEY